MLGLEVPRDRGLAVRNGLIACRLHGERGHAVSRLPFFRVQPPSAPDISPVFFIFRAIAHLQGYPLTLAIAAPENQPRGNASGDPNSVAPQNIAWCNFRFSPSEKRTGSHFLRTQIHRVTRKTGIQQEPNHFIGRRQSDSGLPSPTFGKGLSHQSFPDAVPTKQSHLRTNKPGFLMFAGELRSLLMPNASAAKLNKTNIIHVLTCPNGFTRQQECASVLMGCAVGTSHSQPVSYEICTIACRYEGSAMRDTGKRRMLSMSGLRHRRVHCRRHTLAPHGILSEYGLTVRAGPFAEYRE